MVLRRQRTQSNERAFRSSRTYHTVSNVNRQPGARARVSRFLRQTE